MEGNGSSPEGKYKKSWILDTVLCNLMLVPECLLCVQTPRAPYCRNNNDKRCMAASYERKRRILQTFSFCKQEESDPGPCVVTQLLLDGLWHMRLRGN